ncbi:MAG: hypothetical protein K2K23_01085, partial [Muribaculaceae bacterium]|nr:hypothetical protein [Muribaculaceae bacterium]
VRTAFTQEAYDSFLNRMAANVAIISDLEHKQTNIRHAIRIFESVLEKAEARGLVTRSDAYSCAWCLKEGISDIEFASMVKAVFRLIGDNLNLPSPVKIPWKDLIRIFLRYDETPFKEQLKTLKAQQDTISLIEALSLKLMAE